MSNEFPIKSSGRVILDERFNQAVKVCQCVIGTAGILTTCYGYVAGKYGIIDQKKQNEICQTGLIEILTSCAPTIYNKLKNGEWFDKAANSLMDTTLKRLSK